MADNVTLPGTGASIASDDVGGVQYQRAKIDLGGDGAASPLVRGQQTAANGIPIAPPNDDIITSTITITRPNDANAYAANDTFANSTTTPTAGGFTFSGVARASGGAVMLSDMDLIYSVATLWSGEVWIFDSSVTAVNDNAAFSLSVADAQKLVGIVPFTINRGFTNGSACEVANINKIMSAVGTADLRFLIKVLSVWTPSALATLTLRAKFIRVS